MFRPTLLTCFVAPLLAATLCSHATAAELEPGRHVLKPLSDDFHRLARLAGVWEGTADGPEGERPVTVEYVLTSGNSALVERLFKGSPEEMTSVYHDDGDGLMMTHYCGLGNQPRYRATGFDGDAITFAFHDASNMATPTEMHMHGVKLSMPSEDELRQEWEHYHDGQPAGTVSVTLRRVAE